MTPRRFFFSLASAIAIAAPGSALADPDLPPADDPPPPRQRTAAVLVNPLSLVVNRFSLTIELQRAPHHTLLLTTHVNVGTPPLYYGCDDAASLGGGCSKPAFSGGGVEIGYHLTTGGSLDGFFAGPSLLAAYYTNTESSSSSFGAYGVAVDLGWKWQTSGAGLVMLGIGAALLSVPDHTDLPAGGTAVTPRVLFGVGPSW